MFWNDVLSFNERINIFLSKTVDMQDMFIRNNFRNIFIIALA